MSTKIPKEENVGDSYDNASSINIKIDSAFPVKTLLSTELSPVTSLTHSQHFNETPEEFNCCQIGRLDLDPKVQRKLLCL